MTIRQLIKRTFLDQCKVVTKEFCKYSLLKDFNRIKEGLKSLRIIITIPLAPIVIPIIAYLQLKDYRETAQKHPNDLDNITIEELK